MIRKLLYYTFEFDGDSGNVVYIFNGIERANVVRQRFSNDDKYKSSIENVWYWNGNKEKPSIQPSFRMVFPDYTMIHLFVLDGKLDILSDTTIDTSNYRYLNEEEFKSFNDVYNKTSI